MKTSRITVTDVCDWLSSGSRVVITARRKEHELERNQEQALREKIDSLFLSPILGFGNYTAQVDIQLDLAR